MISNAFGISSSAFGRSASETDLPAVASGSGAQRRVAVQAVAGPFDDQTHFLAAMRREPAMQFGTGFRDHGSPFADGEIPLFRLVIGRGKLRDNRCFIKA